MAAAMLKFTVKYNPKVTNLDEIVTFFDILLRNAISTDGILDNIGNPDVSYVHGYILRKNPNDT